MSFSDLIRTVIARSVHVYLQPKHLLELPADGLEKTSQKTSSRSHHDRNCTASSDPVSAKVLPESRANTMKKTRQKTLFNPPASNILQKSYRNFLSTQRDNTNQKDISTYPSEHNNDNQHHVIPRFPPTLPLNIYLLLTHSSSDAQKDDQKQPLLTSKAILPRYVSITLYEEKFT